MLLKYSSATQLTFANAQLLEQDCPPFPLQSHHQNDMGLMHLQSVKDMES